MAKDTPLPPPTSTAVASPKAPGSTDQETPPQLQLEGVAVEVGGSTHLYDTDLSLAAGLNVLIGSTGAGKTTLMRLMAGLDRPTRGRITLNGRDMSGVAVQKRNTAMVYQQFINYPSLTVYQNIASPLKIQGVPRTEIDRRVQEVAELVRIDHLLNLLPAELSGGQQQRTAMARALVKDAQLLLFDEPLVNLDYKLREELRTELRDLFKRRRAIVVYATTEPLEALLLGGHLVVMDRGRVLQSGPTVAVYHRPNSVRVGEVFSDPPINLMDGQVSDGEAQLGGGWSIPLQGHLQGRAPGSYRFGIRANHLSITPVGPDAVPLATTIELAEVNGSETFIHVGHHGGSWVVQEEGVHPMGLGQGLQVFLDPHHLFAFDGDGRLVAAPPRPGTRASTTWEGGHGSH
ncbi:MAG: ABC transporter ATP-binding protein [Candidatus Competibacterales bacterium]